MFYEKKPKFADTRRGYLLHLLYSTHLKFVLSFILFKDHELEGLSLYLI